MPKKLIASLFSIFLILSQASPVNAQESIRYKSTESQTIKRGKWTTLKFKGNNAIQGNGKRSLFCYQVGIDMNGKKKPKYIKIRLTRIKPDGKKDTTATNYFPIDSKPSSEFVASNCWTIKSKYPVVAQVRISGGSSAYNSDIRQFKMWTPGADYPTDFSDFIPEVTLD